MSNPEQINLGEKASGEVLKDALNGVTSIHQILQGVARIEQRLSAIESRLSGGSVVRKVTDKPNPRNILISMLVKGWVTEDEAMEKTGWQTVGVRSLLTKMKTQGYSVETEQQGDVVRYRLAR